jgi:hypothetical protein
MGASSFQKILMVPLLKVATMTDRSSLQNETGLPIKHGPLLIVFTIAPFSKKSSFESILYGFQIKS